MHRPAGGDAAAPYHSKLIPLHPPICGRILGTMMKQKWDYECGQYPHFIPSAMRDVDRGDIFHDCQLRHAKAAPATAYRHLTSRSLARSKIQPNKIDGLRSIFLHKFCSKQDQNALISCKYSQAEMSARRCRIRKLRDHFLQSSQSHVRTGTKRK